MDKLDIPFQFFENLPIPLLVVTLEGKCVKWNRSAIQAFPTLNKSRNLLTDILLLTDDLSGWPEVVLEVAQRKEVYKGELKVEGRLFEVTVIRVQDQITNQMLFICAFQDKTKEMQLRQQLNDFQQELEACLQDSQRVRGIQTSELSEFAHSMAHDLRNHVSAIKGHITRSLDEELGVEVRQHVLKALHYSKEIEGLLMKNLELAEAGQVIDTKSIVPLRPLVEKVAAVTLLSTNLLLSDELPSLLADETKLYQLLKNLFENAVVHGHASFVRVRVFPREGSLLLKIMNDGSLITQSKVEEIMKGETSGLGMKTVFKIAIAHGWAFRIQVSNVLTTASLVIPQDHVQW